MNKKVIVVICITLLFSGALYMTEQPPFGSSVVATYYIINKINILFE